MEALVTPMMDINASSRIDIEILDYLQNNRRTHRRQATKKQIHTHAKLHIDADNSNPSGNTTASKKDVKRALKRLVKQGCITKNDKTYTFVFIPGASDGGSVSGDASYSATERMQSGSDSDEDEELVLPIAKRMRQNAYQEPVRKHHVDVSRKIDLDDEIERLEAELQADDSESDDEGSESDEDTEKRITGPPSKKAISFGANSIHKYDKGNNRSCWQEDESDDNFPMSGIISLSNFANERIESLPQSALPQNKRRKMKIDSTSEEDMKEQSNTEREKRKRSSSEPTAEHKISAGLKSAVADLLQNYVPSSQLALPFYCRVCQHQSATQEEFNVHRASNFHEGAVREEQKRTYCKLCRKQLTSIVQMKEHLKSRPHREKMNFVKGKQRGGSSGRGGSGRGQGGRGGTKQRNDTRRRQWC